MKAIFRHEISSCFTNLTAYVFGAFLLLFVGIFVMVYNFNYSLSNFEYVLGNMDFVFIIIVPVLTMRTLAEEKHQKTDQLLYSLPLSMTQVVLGKYAAMLCIFMIPMAVVCIYPIILTAYGSVYLPAAFGAVAGFFFLGASLIAIGVFISSVTESQAIAAGICFAVMLLNYYLYDLAGFISSSAISSLIAFIVIIAVAAAVIYHMTKNIILAIGTGAVLETALIITYVIKGDSFEALFPEIISNLSLFERFYVFINGVFDITGIVYFVSVIAVFLFLSIQAMDKRRWSD